MTRHETWPLTSAVIAAFLTFTVSVRGSAQVTAQPVQHEVRLDALFAQSIAVHAGYGVSVPAGLYVRTGVIVAAGAGRHGLEGRTDLIGRFSFDPLRQSRWGPYGGAGLSARFNSTEDRNAKAYLLFFLGLEGPLRSGRSRGWVPALEAGLGGGARVGIVIRRGIHSRR